MGSVLSNHLFDALRDPEAKAVSQEAYNAAIEQLTVESWRREQEHEDDEDEDDED